MCADAHECVCPSMQRPHLPLPPQLWDAGMPTISCSVYAGSRAHAKYLPMELSRQPRNPTSRWLQEATMQWEESKPEIS